MEEKIKSPSEQLKEANKLSYLILGVVALPTGFVVSWGLTVIRKSRDSAKTTSSRIFLSLTVIVILAYLVLLGDVLFTMLTNPVPPFFP